MPVFIIDHDSFSASISGVVAFAFALYATLGRDGGFDSSSSSPKMTTRLLTHAALLGLIRVDNDGSHRRNPKA